ncbi:hypothetical protein CYMTET_27774 [Cymbomonas tetramitiformis]|uniref:EF-hand domain-containing protein n=1 Tax=Cymbomonas tetramitiformis TaxID=36881 RepID=A0AAE0FPN9_9CHLO|nr:hypothetical protein CYMTET_27774 [Cymbomonas tetramitiformis]
MSKRETLRGEALHSKVHDLVARVNARKQANQQQADIRAPGSRITGHYRQGSVLHNGFRDSTSEALSQSNTRQVTPRHDGHNSSSALPESQTTPLVPNNPVPRSRVTRGSGEEGVPETSANARTPEDLIELINNSQARQPGFEIGAQKIGAQPPAGDPPDLGASIKPSVGNVPGRAAHSNRQDQHSGSSRSLGHQQASSTGGGEARAEDVTAAQFKHFTEEQRAHFQDLFCRFDSGNRGFIGRYEALFALADLRLLDEVNHRQAGRLLETHFTRISLNRSNPVSHDAPCCQFVLTS